MLASRLALAKNLLVLQVGQVHLRGLPLTGLFQAACYSLLPGAVCHSDQPTYNNATCPVVQAEWATAVFHQANTISNYWNNFNNDCCLPFPLVPCSGEGYPVYVVNATSADDVKKGVDFARRNDVRMVVKATGHDYLGR